MGRAKKKGISSNLLIILIAVIFVILFLALAARYIMKNFKF